MSTITGYGLIFVPPLWKHRYTVGLHCLASYNPTSIWTPHIPLLYWTLNCTAQCTLLCTLYSTLCSTLSCTIPYTFISGGGINRHWWNWVSPTLTLKFGHIPGGLAFSEKKVYSKTVPPGQITFWKYNGKSIFGHTIFLDKALQNFSFLIVII